jgi:hypothetical protein
MATQSSCAKAIDVAPDHERLRMARPGSRLMGFKQLPITWHGYLAGLAAVMAGVAVYQKRWLSVLIEAAMCTFFFIREAQVQRARRRQVRDQDRYRADSGSHPPGSI